MRRQGELTITDEDDDENESEEQEEEEVAVDGSSHGATEEANNVEAGISQGSEDEDNKDNNNSDNVEATKDDLDVS